MRPPFKILCQAYEFEDAVEYNYRNYFNPASARHVVGPEIDLFDFLISSSEFSFTRLVNDNFEKNSLRYEFSDLRINVSGIKDSRFLESYFLVTDNSARDAYRKYRVKVYYNNSFLMFGFISPDSIAENFRRPKGKNDTNIISLQIVSAEKELKNYINGVNLPDHTLTFDSGGILLPWYYDNRAEEGGTKYCSSLPVPVLLNNIFLGTVLFSSSLIGDWNVANVPQLFNSAWSGNWFIRSGYKRWVSEGLSSYAFFDALLKSFGWTWAYNPESNYITVRNIAEFGLPVLELDFSQNAGFDISFSSPESVKHVIVPDGQLSAFKYRTGLGSEKGPRFKIVSNTARVNNFTNFWQWIEGVAGNGQAYVMHVDDFFRSSAKNREDGKSFFYGERWIKNQDWNQLEVENYSLALNECLIVDAGSQSQMKSVMDPASTLNYPGNETGESLYDILYSGNVGACCFKSEGWYVSQDYDAYCRSSQFRDNYLPLIGGVAGKNIVYNHKGIILNPEQTVRFYNVPDKYPLFKYGTFAVTGLQFDPAKLTSKFNLIRK